MSVSAFGVVHDPTQPLGKSDDSARRLAAAGAVLGAGGYGLHQAAAGMPAVRSKGVLNTLHGITSGDPAKTRRGLKLAVASHRAAPALAHGGRAAMVGAGLLGAAALGSATGPRARARPRRRELPPPAADDTAVAKAGRHRMAAGQVPLWAFNRAPQGKVLPTPKVHSIPHMERNLAGAATLGVAAAAAAPKLLARAKAARAARSASSVVRAAPTARRHALVAAGAGTAGGGTYLLTRHRPDPPAGSEDVVKSGRGWSGMPAPALDPGVARAQALMQVAKADLGGPMHMVGGLWVPGRGPSRAAKAAASAGTHGRAATEAARSELGIPHDLAAPAHGPKEPGRAGRRAGQAIGRGARRVLDETAPQAHQHLVSGARFAARHKSGTAAAAGAAATAGGAAGLMHLAARASGRAEAAQRAARANKLRRVAIGAGVAGAGGLGAADLGAARARKTRADRAAADAQPPPRYGSTR
jgi:hypothetical protein